MTPANEATCWPAVEVFCRTRTGASLRTDGWWYQFDYWACWSPEGVCWSVAWLATGSLLGPNHHKQEIARGLGWQQVMIETREKKRRKKGVNNGEGTESRCQSSLPVRLVKRRRSRGEEIQIAAKKKSHRERGSGKLKKRKQGVLASAKRGCKLLR